VVVVTELLAVIVLVWLTWWCWHRGVIVAVRNGVALRRIEGRWWALATGAATLAGILMLDALRQVVLVGAARARRHPSEDGLRYR
jgi:small-conductance mechanosensitive channel